MSNLVWCGILAAGLGVWGWGVDSAAGGAGGPASGRATGVPAARGPAVIQDRLTQEIALLKAESLEESLKMLSEIEMFRWPGYRADRSGAIVMPLKAEMGQFEIEEIMSNRRFLKVMDGLAALPKGEAAALVKREIQGTLPVYQKMFDAAVDRLMKGRAAAPPGVRMGSGLAMQINNNPDHSPTLAGARLKLLALVLAAGNLDLAEASAAVREVVTCACGQRDQFYKPYEGLAEADRFFVLKDASLYNRQILVCGIMQRLGMKAAKDRDPWEERRLTKFDARTTPYDGMAGGRGRGDFAHGEIMVAFPRPISDEAFKEILKGQIG
jgi:hypothetical protein